MITCHLLGGEFEDIETDDFEMIAHSISEGGLALAAMPMEAIIGLLSLLGKSIIRDPYLAAQEGSSYISLWLRKDNLERICRLSFAAVSDCPSSSCSSRDTANLSSSLADSRRRVTLRRSS